jgi:hypothetical protein
VQIYSVFFRAISALASASGDGGIAGEAGAFQDQAARILLESRLGDVKHGALVCISINGAPLNPLLLVEYAAVYGRDLGEPQDCLCVPHKGRQMCFERGTTRPACSLAIDSFLVQSHFEASAQLVISCGWPEGEGEVARFAKMEGRWWYAGQLGRLVF